MTSTSALSTVAPPKATPVRAESPGQAPDGRSFGDLFAEALVGGSDGDAGSGAGSASNSEGLSGGQDESPGEGETTGTDDVQQPAEAVVPGPAAGDAMSINPALIGLNTAAWMAVEAMGDGTVAMDAASGQTVGNIPIPVDGQSAGNGAVFSRVLAGSGAPPAAAEAAQGSEGTVSAQRQGAEGQPSPSAGAPQGALVHSASPFAEAVLAAGVETVSGQENLQETNVPDGTPMAKLADTAKSEGSAAVRGDVAKSAAATDEELVKTQAMAERVQTILAGKTISVTGPRGLHEAESEESEAAGRTGSKLEKGESGGSGDLAGTVSLTGRRVGSATAHAGSSSADRHGDSAAEDRQDGAGEADRMLRDLVVGKKEAPAPGVGRPGDASPGLSQQDKAAVTQAAVFRADAGALVKDTGHMTYRMEKLQDLVDHVDRHILSLTRSGDKSMTITLIPEKLGKVVLSCTEEGSRLTVQIQAENGVAREMLQRQEGAIRTLLEQNGYKMGQFDVRTNDHNSSGGRQTARRGAEDMEPDELGGIRRFGKATVPPPEAGVAGAGRSGGIWLVA